ncbi:MAG: hypothetical protein WCR42_07560, partial [bacterium]
MKTKLFIIVLCFIITSIITVFSQDENIEQLSVIYKNQVKKLCDTVDGFKGPNQLLRGYQWGNNRSVSQAIFANQNSIKIEFFCVNPVTNIFEPNPEELQNNAYILVCDPRFWSGTLYDTTLMHSHSMTFEPTLYITENNPTQYQILAKRPNDPTRPIFGFTQIDNLARIPTDVANSDSSFLILKNTNLINHKVFSDPWGSEFLFRTDYKPWEIDSSKKDQKNYQGYNYCVSVNLKRLGPKFPEADLNAPVLEIKLPYTLHNNSTGYITFDSIPSLPLGSIITTCGEYRGKKTTMVNLSDTATSFIIRQNMLPGFDTAVTVTARFRCWGRDPNQNPNFSNRRLSTPTTRISDEIRKLGFEAYYRVGCFAAVNYVRICTPHSVDLFEGKMDAVIKKVIQSDIDTIKHYNTDLTSKNIKIHRFNASTEGSVQNFDVEKYITRLIGNVFATTTTPIFPILFDYYVQPPNRMLNIGFVNTTINAPYIKRGEKDINLRYRTFGWISGREQANTYDFTPLTLEEQLNSRYETYYPFTLAQDALLGVHYNYSHYQVPNLPLSRIYRLRCADGDDSPSRSFQAFHQFNMWHTFYNDSTSGFQYLNTPWYFQTQNLTWWERIEHVVHKDSLVYDNDYIDFTQTGLNYSSEGDYRKFSSVQMKTDGRPFTAEETRLLANTALSQGAKGLMIDGVSYYHSDMFTRMAHKTALEFNPLGPTDDYYEYLSREEYGGDYFDFDTESVIDTSNHLQFDKFSQLIFRYFKQNVDNNLFTQKYLGVDYNKCYSGRKSNRLELYKIHKWLIKNESILLKLKLKCSYSKGIFTNYNQHPAAGPGILMDSYISKSGIKTRKLWQPLESGDYAPVTTYEPDSARFFDITILSRDTFPMNKNFILTVVNRRTDPSVWLHDNTQLQGGNWHIQFIPSSEFDDLCKISGPEGEFWKTMIYKRFGCREISIPMKKPTGYENSEVAFRVTELGYDNDSLKKEFWFQEPYNHVIDTNLLVGDTLRLRLLPGAMKMVNVEVVTPNNVTPGDLDYSNQTKLVAFPCDSNYNAQDTTSMGRVRYHMVYSRALAQYPYNHRVYYRRSKPMER